MKVNDSIEDKELKTPFEEAYDLAYEVDGIHFDMKMACPREEEDLMREAIPLCNKIGTLIKNGSMTEEETQHIIRILGGCSGED